jgi:hypothetical protein
VNSDEHAGKPLAQKLDDDPEAKAALINSLSYTKARIATQMSSLKESHERALEAVSTFHRLNREQWSEWASALQKQHQADLQQIADSGFPIPRTNSDWRQLAIIAKIPFEVIKSGEYTMGDVKEWLAAWAIEERARLKIQATEAANRPDLDAIRKAHKLRDIHIRVLRIIIDHGPISGPQILTTLNNQSHTYSDVPALDKGALRKLRECALIESTETGYIGAK